MESSPTACCVHGLGVQTAEGMAEWLHAKVRSQLAIGPAQGRRYSWGYPSCPEQSELAKVFPLLDAASIGLRLSGGFDRTRRSTLAIDAPTIPRPSTSGCARGCCPVPGG